MTPEGALAEAQGGKLRPIYLIVGQEPFVAAEVVKGLSEATETGPKGLNDEKCSASDTTASRIVSAAQTLPMMAKKRLVLLRGLEHWDRPGAAGGGQLDELARYAAHPNDSTVLLLVAHKLNGSRRLCRLAKKEGFVVRCEPLPRPKLAPWIRARSKTLGHALSAGTADTLAELVGPELGPVADALNRLSLYVGSGQPITEQALVQVVSRVRQQTTWDLVDALSSRDHRAVLSALHDTFDARDAGLPLLGAMAWRVRQLIKFDAALKDGGSSTQAAKAAAVPPFRARQTEATVRALPAGKLSQWMLLLAEADLALKGSRRPGKQVLSTMLIDMCR